MRTREHYSAEDWTLFLKCSKCWIFKPAKEYNKGKKCFMWLQPKCRECQHIKNKEHYNNNSDIYIAKAKKRRAQNLERYNELEKKRRKGNPEAVKEAAKKRIEKKTRLYWFKPTILHRKANHYINKHSLRTSCCSICGSNDKIEFHHTDSSNEDARNIWVFCCKHCHEKIHTWEIECPGAINLTDLI